MPRPIKVGRKERMTFAKINEVCEMPNLIQIQTDSYKDVYKRQLFEDCITWGASSKIRIYIIIPRVRLMRIPITKGVIMNQSEAIIRPPANVDKATPEMRDVLVVFFSCLNVEYITIPIGIL